MTKILFQFSGARVAFLFPLFLLEFEFFRTIEIIRPKNGLFKMNRPENTLIEQILNSKDVEARETFPTFEHCSG